MTLRTQILLGLVVSAVVACGCFSFAARWGLATEYGTLLSSQKELSRQVLRELVAARVRRLDAELLAAVGNEKLGLRLLQSSRGKIEQLGTSWWSHGSASAQLAASALVSGIGSFTPAEVRNSLNGKRQHQVFAANQKAALGEDIEIRLLSPVFYGGVAIGVINAGESLSRWVLPTLEEITGSRLVTAATGSAADERAGAVFSASIGPDTQVELTLGSSALYSSSQRVLWMVLAAALITICVLTLSVAGLLEKGLLRHFHRAVDVLKRNEKSLTRGHLPNGVLEANGPSEFRTLAHAINSHSEAIHLYSQRLAFKKQTELVGENTSQILHDLRGPLASLEMVVDSGDTSARQRELAAKILCQIKNIVAKQGVGNLALDGALVDVPAAVDEAMAICLRRWLPIKGVRIYSADCDSSVRWFGNRSELIRTVCNLLDNACEATPQEDAQVCVSVLYFGSQIEVQVQDNGSGIKPLALSKVMERGFSSKLLKGSGLGLWQAKTFCENLGGQLLLDRSGLGGARVVLRFSSMLQSMGETNELAQ